MGEGRSYRFRKMHFIYCAYNSGEPNEYVFCDPNFMKRIILFFALFWAVVPHASALVDAPNLVPNPSFETAVYPDYWALGDADFARVRDGAAGKYAMQIARSPEAADGHSRLISKTTHIVLTEDTKAVAFAVWLKGENLAPNQAQISINFWDEETVSYLSGTDLDVSPASDWQKFMVVTDEIPDNAHYVRIEIRLKGSGTLWVDALQLTANDGTLTAPALPYTVGNYYVSPNGDDGNDGSEERPFATIQHALDTAVAGDIILVREGVYHETISFNTAGSADAPIVLAAYPNERPVIDGMYQLPPVPPSGWARCADPADKTSCFHYDPLVNIAADHVVFAGFDVQRSLGRAVLVHHPERRVQNVQILHNSVHDNRNTGIKMLQADYVLVQGNAVWHASDYAPFDRTANELDWTHAVNALRSTNITYRANKIFNNYGEGLGTGRGSTNIVIEDNELYDNRALNLYIHRSQDVLIQRNKIYCTGNPQFLRGGNIPAGIVANNESQFGGMLTVDRVLVQNNIVAGCSIGFGIWGGGGGSVKNGSRNVTVLHNTFVNLQSNPDIRDPYAFSLIGAADHENILIQSNLIYQADPIINAAGDLTAVTFVNNGWLAAPLDWVLSDSDVVSRDLGMANPDAELIADQFNVSNYKLKRSAAAIDRAVETAVCCDFFERKRDDAPDLGFFEFQR